MNIIREISEQARRTAADIFNGGPIANASPSSPEVPEDLRSWLPDLFDRFPIVLPWSKPSPVDPALHNIWILDNTAFRTPQPGDRSPDLAELSDPNHTQPRLTAGPDAAAGQTKPVGPGSGWEVEFVACYFIKGSGKDIASTTAALMRHLNISDDDVATKKRIAARLEPFVDTVLPNRTLRISIGGEEEQVLGPSSYAGISSGLHELHFTPTSPTTQSSAVNLPPPFGLPSHTVFAEGKGWGVISDIDDTIKFTQTTSAFGILQNTFVVDEPQPIEGMPELYAKMNATLHNPAFFYLSASPYNLYPFLKRFREAHYPQGTIILRDASWQNLGGLIASLQLNTEEYKSDRITKIHSWLPHRKVICIGDSTQSDPEAYGDAARKYPGWIKAVFIREVSGIAGMDDKTKNAPERFETAFRGLERGLWCVFSDPTEVAQRVEELSRDGDADVLGVESKDGDDSQGPTAQ
ncbi:hypothetical protein LTR85_010509 [Meristemomyces frigidus]|nr:hypothetical protein LTR85_010509 [Meristemomyces frigidus]